MGSAVLRHHLPGQVRRAFEWPGSRWTVRFPLRIEHAPWRAAYPHDQHSFPSTPSTRLTRLASLSRVYRSYLFYNGVRDADLWGILAMRSRKSRHKQRAAPGEPARCVNSAGRAARGRAGVAPGHNLWAVCSAVRPNVLRPCLSNEMLVCLSHLSNLCSLATVVWSVRAHT